MCQFIKFCSCQVHIKVFWTFACSCDEWQVDVCCCCGRQLFLCFLCCFFQSLQCHFISRKVYAFFCFEVCQHVICDLLVEVITTQSVVTGCRQYFDNAVTNFNNRYIESTATKVINHDFLFFLIVQSVCQSSCCRLVDDTFYIETCDFSGIFCCLTLCVIEVCRNCDNCLCNLLSKISFCICFQFLKDHSRNFLWRIFLAFDVYSVVRTHLSFNRRNCVVCICNSLTFCRLTYQSLAAFCKCNNRWCCSCSF